MAVVWNTTFDSGRYFYYGSSTTIVGYGTTYWPLTGTLADTTADMYSATLDDIYFYGENTTSGYIRMQFDGTQTGGWTHVKIGPTIFAYGDFTRTTGMGKTTFQYAYNHKTSDRPFPFPSFSSSGFTGRTRLTFYDSDPGAETPRYGVEIRNAVNNRVWTNEERHMVVCAAGFVYVTSGGNTTISADDVDTVSIMMLDTDNDNAPYAITSSNLTSTSFRINNGSLDPQLIGYTAFRRP
jgi:hypothetical protein